MQYMILKWKFHFIDLYQWFSSDKWKLKEWRKKLKKKKKNNYEQFYCTSSKWNNTAEIAQNINQTIYPKEHLWIYSITGAYGVTVIFIGNGQRANLGWGCL